MKPLKNRLLAVATHAALLSIIILSCIGVFSVSTGSTFEETGKNSQPEETNLFLDNGKGGDKFTGLFHEAVSDAKDKRHLYADYGDYNDKLMAEASKKQNNGLNR